MRIYQHRVNTVKELRATSSEYGCEIDIRSEGGELVLHHDPFQEGELLRDWLKEYHHAGLILNVKEAGLESSIRELLKSRSLSDYFFLDQAFPYILWETREGHRKSALRFSEFEPIESLRSMQGLVDWVWVDSFETFSYSRAQIEEISSLGFKICLVSPELQQRSKQDEILSMRNLVKSLSNAIDAVCTKTPSLWVETQKKAI